MPLNNALAIANMKHFHRFARRGKIETAIRKDAVAIHKQELDLHGTFSQQPKIHFLAHFENIDAAQLPAGADPCETKDGRTAFGLFI